MKCRRGLEYAWHDARWNEWSGRTSGIVQLHAHPDEYYLFLHEWFEVSMDATFWFTLEVAS